MGLDVEVETEGRKLVTSTQHRQENGAENTALADAMWRGHGGWEMALTPVVFALGGWYLDGLFGTEPFLIVLGAVIGLVGSVTNQFFQYKHRMAIATEERRALRLGSTAAIASTADVSESAA